MLTQASLQDLGAPLPHWAPRPRPDGSRLIGDYCVLEKLDLTRQARALFRAFQASKTLESWTYLPYGPFETLQSFEQGYQKILNDPDTLLYVILRPHSFEPIGLAGYLRINSEHGTIEIGHLHFSVYLQKTCAATEALFLLISRAFALGYRRVEWKCNSLNQPSINAAKRLGFQCEGIFRQANVFKGYNRDTTWFSILDSEWPRLKQKFEAWLHPQNFDATGQQIQRLEEISVPDALETQR